MWSRVRRTPEPSVVEGSVDGRPDGRLEEEGEESAEGEGVPEEARPGVDPVGSLTPTRPTCPTRGRGTPRCDPTRHPSVVLPDHGPVSEVLSVSDPRHTSRSPTQPHVGTTPEPHPPGTPLGSPDTVKVQT